MMVSKNCPHCGKVTRLITVTSRYACDCGYITEVSEDGIMARGDGVNLPTPQKCQEIRRCYESLLPMGMYDGQASGFRKALELIYGERKMEQILEPPLTLKELPPVELIQRLCDYYHKMQGEREIGLAEGVFKALEILYGDARAAQILEKPLDVGHLGER